MKIKLSGLNEENYNFVHMFQCHKSGLSVRRGAIDLYIYGKCGTLDTMINNI